MLRRLKVLTLPDGGPFIGICSTMQRRWDKVVAEAGILRAALHDLRKMRITRLMMAGVPLPIVQKLDGHKSIKTAIDHHMGLQ